MQFPSRTAGLIDLHTNVWLQAAAAAAMQRVRDQEACGCDEVHGTQITYDDSRGEVIVLDEDESVDRSAISHRDKPGKDAQLAASKDKIRAKPDSSHVSDAGEKVKKRESAAETGPSLNKSARRSKPRPEVIDLTELDSEEGSPVLLPFKGAENLPQKWICNACTYINPSDSSTCEMCSTAR